MPTSRLHQPPRIFVSHSHKDNDFGMRLIADLRAALGEDEAVWYDVSGGLHGGDAWWRRIVAELSARSVFIIILSPDAMASPWVNDEIDLAWKQKNSPEGKVIVPVLCRVCQIREDLQTRQIVSFLPPKAYETALAELFAALGLPAPRPVPEPTPLIERTAPADVRLQSDVTTAALASLAASSVPAAPAIEEPPAPERRPEPKPIPAEAVVPPSARNEGAASMRPAVSRRSFLRQGGIATGVGLAALAGAGLLAHAAHPGGSSGAGAHPTTTTRPTTPTPPTITKTRWAKSLGGSISGSPLFINGQLFIGASGGLLYAFDAGGAQLWLARLDQRGVTCTPIVAAVPGILCTASGEYLYGLDIGTGKVQWTATYAQLGIDVLDSQPVAASGIVYLFNFGGLLAYQATTGTTWAVGQATTVPDIATDGFVPAVDGDFIYAITAPRSDAQVQRYRLSGGDPDWTHRVGSALTSPIVAGNLLYVGAADSYLYTLRTSDGAEVWKYQTSAPISKPPTFDSGVVYVASGSTLHALDAASGAFKWKTPIGAPAYSKPVVANGIVYIGAGNYIYTFDISAGSLLRRFQVSDVTSDEVASTPIVAGTTLYAATGNGRLSAFTL